MTIKEALQAATSQIRSSNSPSAYLDAEVLLLHTLKRKKDVKDKSWIYINGNYVLSPKEEKCYFDFVKRRCDYEPVAYIIERKEFYGYDFYVNSKALIPRPETEMIVNEVLKILGGEKENLRKCNIIDIGTGSGCIIISILNELSKTGNRKLIDNAIANDISNKAIEIAKRNARKYSLEKRIKFICKDFSEIFRKKDFFNDSEDLIVTANLPYIKKKDYGNLQKNIKYEPKLALVAGKDGLIYINKLIQGLAKANRAIHSRMHILIECDPHQINEIIKLLGKYFPSSRSMALKDLSKKRRLVKVDIEK